MVPSTSLAQLICDAAQQRRSTRHSYWECPADSMGSACDASHCSTCPQKMKVDHMDVFRDILAAVRSWQIASRFVSTLREETQMAAQRLCADAKCGPDCDTRSTPGIGSNKVASALRLAAIEPLTGAASWSLRRLRRQWSAP